MAGKQNWKSGGRERLRESFFYSLVILEELISAGGNTDHKLKSGMYFIRFVASRNNLELLKVVISESSDLNKLMYHDQYTIFIGMLREIDVQTLEYVLENTNADVNYRAGNGSSALYHLYDRGECGLDCIEILLRNCADPMLEINPGGESFEDYITRINDIEVLKLINETEC